ncbi:MAG: peptide-methionine (S)-S-oxide reductase MsrA, partial [Clostridia bacterium]|nr:peptide-methionine (S)-S-oxide reductase MsrA [Clostridia bacterium]
MAYLAGGCFWCIEAPLSMTPGVVEVLSGYAGGDEVAPTYHEVKSQATHHRETIKITYDPSILSYEELLKAFLSHIDPLDDEGQFGDVGRSYTTAIYYQDEEERAIAERLLSALAVKLGETPTVAVEPMKRFWVAEEEHLHYYL